MRNIRLTLAYDGTNYVGWQVQPNGPSVQQAVEQAILLATGEEARLLVAGRTDSGVHALAQVANFWSNTTIPCAGLRLALQTKLPEDIVIRGVEEVDVSFHATYSAKKKHYRYIIHNNPVPHPLLRKYAFHWRGLLDADAMHESAQVLVGTHDFRTFETDFPNKASSVRTVFEASVTRQAGWSAWESLFEPAGSNAAVNSSSRATAEHPFLWIDIVADGFLYNMVRAIAGTLLRVGEHKWTADDVRRILNNQDRAEAGSTAPPQGLYLVDVDYGELVPTPREALPSHAGRSDE